MTKVIKYFSALEFKKYMKGIGFLSYNYNRENVSKEYIENNNFAVISIGNLEKENGDFDNELWRNGSNSHWLPNAKNVLNIDFNDVVGHEKGALSELQAQEILYFIENNKDKDNWYIHCSAGISRSGAVASIVYEYLKSNNESVVIKPEYPKTPNYYIRKMLNNEMFF